jgi:aspartate/methionine/tyrosine aminotransferase
MVAAFQRRRDLLIDGLNKIPGFHCVKPEGAFYAFPNVTGTGMEEREMADRLLNEAGVAVLPGTAFGEGGRGHIRLAYTQSDDNLTEALARIERFMAEATTTA